MHVEHVTRYRSPVLTARRGRWISSPRGASRHGVGVPPWPGSARIREARRDPCPPTTKDELSRNARPCHTEPSRATPCRSAATRGAPGHHPAFLPVPRETIRVGTVAAPARTASPFADMRRKPVQPPGHDWAARRRTDATHDTSTTIRPRAGAFVRSGAIKSPRIAGPRCRGGQGPGGGPRLGVGYWKTVPDGTSLTSWTASGSGDEDRALGSDPPLTHRP